MILKKDIGKFVKRNKSFQTGTPFYFVATPIGNLSEFPRRALEVLEVCDFICVEDTRVSGKLLQHFAIAKPLIAVHKFSEQAKVDEIIDKLQKGEKGAFLSDAGYPLLSDPGDILLRHLLLNNINVSVVNGPSALLPALILSNLPITPFTFIGFLPVKEGEQKKAIAKLQTLSSTLVFYEAPHRVNKTIAALYATLGERKLVIARELSKIHEEYIYTTLQEYTENPLQLKGEIVLIISGSTSAKKHDYSEYLTHVHTLIAANYRANEAIKIVSTLFNISKNELYELYLTSKQ